MMIFVYAVAYLTLYLLFPLSVMSYNINERQMSVWPVIETYWKVFFGAINVALAVVGLIVSLKFFHGFLPAGYEWMDGKNYNQLFEGVGANILVFREFLSYVDAGIFGWIEHLSLAPAMQTVADLFMSLMLVFKVMITIFLVVIVRAVVITASRIIRPSSSYFGGTFEEIKDLWMFLLLSISYTFEIIFFGLFLSILYTFEIIFFGLFGPALLLLIVPSIVLLALEAVMWAMIAGSLFVVLGLLGWYLKTKAEVDGRFY
jgi:hypothetical protein